MALAAVVIATGATLGAGASPSAAASPRAGERTLLVSGEGAAEWRDLVGDVARRAAAELPLRVGAELPDSTRIVLCIDVRDFRRFAGGMDVRDLLGVAHPAARLVALNLGELGPGPERSLVGTLRHELVHVALGGVVARAARTPYAYTTFPRWFDEGVASWFGGRYSELGAIEAEALTGADWLALDRLHDSFPEDLRRRRLAYQKSLLAVEHLEAQRPGAVAAVVARLDAGEEFAAALVAASGMSVADLDRATRQDTRRRWLRDVVLRGVGSPYGVMALLVIVGFLLRRWRYQRALGRMAATEDREPPR